MFFLYCNESANSMLTAVNSFLRYMERPDCFVWQLKVPRTAYCSQDKKLKLEEYKRLVAAAEKNGFSSSFYCSKQSVIRVFRCPRQSRRRYECPRGGHATPSTFYRWNKP